MRKKIEVPRGSKEGCASLFESTMNVKEVKLDLGTELLRLYLDKEGGPGIHPHRPSETIARLPARAADRRREEDPVSEHHGRRVHRAWHALSGHVALSRPCYALTF